MSENLFQRAQKSSSPSFKALYDEARSKKSPFVVLEGFHSIKHALRFEAEIQEILTPDASSLEDLFVRYAPDVREKAKELLIGVSEEAFLQCCTHRIHTRVLARARKPRQSKRSLQEYRSHKRPIILLDNPRDMGNLGACIRLAAAYGVSAVGVLGEVDPWRSPALRGSAGLHFAQPIFSLSSVEEVLQAPLPKVVFDERGRDFTEYTLPRESIVIFGSERDGVRQELRENADLLVRIPMQDRVSSLNLATAVAAGLYGGNWREGAA